MYPIQVENLYNSKELPNLGHIYTTVYMWNYVSGDFREDSGSHLGVDIVPEIPWDSVYSVMDGEVLKAEENSFSGKYITIFHPTACDMDDPKKIRGLVSCYLHLSKITVEPGQKVEEGEIIGNTGSSWMSTGEHLHFQIDTTDAPYHPYWPFTMSEANEKGFGFIEAINEWLGKDLAKLYTVNPLVYLNKYKTQEKKEDKKIISDEKNIIHEDKEDAEEDKKNKESKKEDIVFTDVSPENKAIYYLVKNNIVHGFSDGTFKPKNPITRAELLKVSFLASKTPVKESQDTRFPDVVLGHWSAPYISSALELGIVRGYGDGLFRPNNLVSRIEAFAIILRTFFWEEKIIKTKYTRKFEDIDASHWSAPYVEFLLKNNLFSFVSERVFPDTPISREDVAILLYNINHSSLKN